MSISLAAGGSLRQCIRKNVLYHIRSCTKRSPLRVASNAMLVSSLPAASCTAGSSRRTRVYRLPRPPPPQQIQSQCCGRFLVTTPGGEDKLPPSEPSVAGPLQCRSGLRYNALVRTSTINGSSSSSSRSRHGVLEGIVQARSQQHTPKDVVRLKDAHESIDADYLETYLNELTRQYRSQRHLHERLSLSDKLRALHKLLSAAMTFHHQKVSQPITTSSGSKQRISTEAHFTSMKRVARLCQRLLRNLSTLYTSAPPVESSGYAESNVDSQLPPDASDTESVFLLRRCVALGAQLYLALSELQHQRRQHNSSLDYCVRSIELAESLRQQPGSSRSLGLRQSVWFWAASLMRSYGQLRLSESALQELLQIYIVQQEQWQHPELMAQPDFELTLRQLADCASTPAARVLAAKLAVRVIMERLESRHRNDSVPSADEAESLLVSEGELLPQLGLLARSLHHNSQHSSCVEIIGAMLELLDRSTVSIHRRQQRARCRRSQSYKSNDDQVNAMYDVLMRCTSSYRYVL